MNPHHDMYVGGSEYDIKIIIDTSNNIKRTK